MSDISRWRRLLLVPCVLALLVARPAVVAATSQAAEKSSQTGVPAAEPLRAVSSQDERRYVSTQVRNSGASHEAWTTKALDAISRSAAQAGGIRLGVPSCYQRGCVVTMTCESMATFLSTSRAFSESATFQKWPGARYRSPPEVVAGKVEADWILFRP